MPPQGLETPSESVMLSVSDEHVGVHFTARLCRYPAYRVAWLWTHVKTPDGFFAYVDHAAPCTEDETPIGNMAHYADAAGVLRFSREGASEDARAAHLAARVSSRESGVVEADLAFRPALMRAGLLEGRVEAFGPIEGDLRVNGRAFRIRGVGQFHEQRQTEARFTTPFAFASLWGEGVGVTLLQIPEDSGGYILQQGASTRTGRVRIAPPSANRTLRIDFGANDAMEGHAVIETAYTIPLYGQTWHGAFVTAELGGHRLRGSLNDWRPEVLFGAS